ncbi:hypothetical protein MPSEU_000414000 [Mayamaea pseudoterrestris]|nr:hypothetical protein MPSEU_000414000 [Mayamaea pseudoterrestris]
MKRGHRNDELHFDVATLFRLEQGNGMSKSSSSKKRKRNRIKSLDNASSSAEKVEVGAAEGNATTASAVKRQRIVATIEPTPKAVDFPYATEEDDHCESPLEAYQDVALLLKRLERNSKNVSEFTIYDPYYCNGAVCQHLKEIGFDHVYNRKEDCYEQWNASASSIGDVIVTNPPYSGDHIQQLLAYVTSVKHCNKAFFLLLPNWVVKKDYYEASCAAANVKPFYLVPRKRYVYAPPKDFRAAKRSDTHKKSAPFISMWYCWGGTSTANEELIKLCYEQSQATVTCDLARSKSALRDLRRKKR